MKLSGILDYFISDNACLPDSFDLNIYDYSNKLNSTKAQILSALENRRWIDASANSKSSRSNYGRKYSAVYTASCTTYAISATVAASAIMSLACLRFTKIPAPPKAYFVAFINN